ncbi:MAG: LuxR C-terminal-related transcriptional regulator [Microbacteriaceae bacterium]
MPSNPSIRFVPRQSRQSLRRERLSKLIDRVGESGLVIVRGAAGSGKTTAMLQWAASQTSEQAAGVWITLDATVSDRFAFWRRVFESLSDAGIDVSARASELVAGEQPVGELHNRLMRAFTGLTAPITLVVDDFHLVDEEGVGDDVALVVRSAPLVRFVIGTRTRGALELPTNSVTLEAVIVDHESLRFTLDESESVTNSMVAGARDGLGGRIHEAVGGWPLATRLVLLELDRFPHLDACAAVERVVSAQLSLDAGTTFLAGEKDSAVLRFALRSALAETVSAELAADLAGGVDTEASLSWFEREGLGSVHPDRAALSFRWQPLVQTALRAEIQRRFAHEVAPAHAIIARWHARHSEPMPAIHHAAAADDWAFVNDVVRQSFSDLMLYHQPELMAVLEEAPRNRLRANLALVAALALLHYASPSSSADRWKSLADFGLGIAGSSLRRDSRTEKLWVHSSVLAVQRITGNYEAAVSTAQRIVSLAASFDTDERAEVRGILPLLTTQVATTFLHTGRAERAHEQLRQVSILTGGTEPWSDIHAACIEALALALDGVMPAVRERLDVIGDRQTPHGWSGSYPAAGYHLATAFAALERFDTEEAVRQVSLLDNHADTIEHWPLLCEIEGIVLLIRGVSDDGAEFSRRVRERQRRTPTSGYLAARMAAVRADLLTSAGRTREARAALAPFAATMPLVALALARTHLQESTPETALQILDRMDLPASPKPRAQAEASLLRATAFLRLGDFSSAERSLAHALLVLESKELARPWMMIPRRDALQLVDRADPSRRAALGALLETVPDLFSAAAPIIALSKRELLVLRELNQTSQASLIAERLFVSPNTVKTQLRSLYRKLGVSSRAEALALAHERRLI